MIPVNQPLLDGNEKKYLLKCIESGWISSEGPFVQEFEQRFAARLGRQYAIAVSNGSAALDIAVEALGVGSGDEVIVPSFTIISCVGQIVRAGAKPVLVDSDPVTWNMDISQLESKITSRTKAIMAVHIYGLTVDMAPLLEIAQRYGLMVIEDAAQMHGQSYRGRPCGSFGDISTFSFYPNKHVTTGEGGMVVTDDEKLAEKARSLRNLCFEAGKRFVHERIGWNYRLTNMQAAIGLAQLERLDQFIQRKRHMGALYTELLGSVVGLQLPQAATDYADNIYWVFGLMLDDSVSFNATEAMELLRVEGVGTRPFFCPMHMQPVLRRQGWYAGESYPVAEKLYARGFYIPSGLALNDDQIHTVANAVRKIMS